MPLPSTSCTPSSCMLLMKDGGGWMGEYSCLSAFPQTPAFQGLCMLYTQGAT